MTENEVIEVLSDFNKCVCVKADGAYETDEFIKAKNAAIEALEEIQQYRAIGTVEEFANAKRMVHIAEIAAEHIEKEKQEIKAKVIP